MICREFQLVFDGIGEATGPIFSVYVGEESHSGLRSSYDLANRTAIVEGVVVTLLLIIIAPLAPRFLNVMDPELMSWVVICIRMTALGSIFISLLYLLTSYYLVIEKIALSVAACALRDVVLSIGLALILSRIFGLYGLFIGIAVAPAIAYGLLRLYLIVRYSNSYVMEMKIMRISGDFYTLRSVEVAGSGMRLKKHRLYATKEDAVSVMESERKKRDSGSMGRYRQW